MNAFLVNALLWPALLAVVGSTLAQTQTREILAVVEKSAEDWNRGDLEAYLHSYEQSPDTTFVGTEVSQGMGEVLDRYRRLYPDAAHMGKTTFSALQARLLNIDLAIVTGRFHLEREDRWGGNRGGLFTLVMRKGPDGWRIIHDHTSTS